MFKAIVTLTPGPDMGAERFVEWWTVEHAPLAAQLPGLRKLIFNVVEDATEPAGPAGFAELWFDSKDAFVDAYASDIGKTVAKDSEDHVASRIRYLVDERTIVG